MNKITFFSEPDFANHPHSFGLKNYDHSDIKNILNEIDDDTTFYLIGKNSSNQWLNIVQEKVKIIFDCDESSIQQIKIQCQKKQT